MRKDYLQQLFAHASSLHQQGDLKGAEIAYRQVLKDHPGHADSHHMLGLVFAQQNQFDKAIEQISRAIKERPSNPIYQNNLGETYKRKGEPDRAMELFQKATTTDPSFAQGYFNQATIWKLKGDYAKTEEFYNKAVSTNPRYFQAYYNLGNLSQEIGNYKTAITHYEKCLAINPKHTQAHNNLATMFQHWDRHDEAQKHFEQAVEIDPDFIESLSNLAKIHDKQGNTDLTEKYYREIARINPNDTLTKFKIQTIAPVVFQSNKAITDYRSRVVGAVDAFENLPIDPKKVHTSAFETFSNLIYLGKDDLNLKLKIASLYENSIPKIPTRKVNPKPHIGFVVTRGHEGVFIKCMRGIINHIPTSKYDVSIVCSLPNGQKILEPVIDNPEVSFLNLHDHLDVSSQAILNAKFDVLHYWEIGTDSTNYLLPFMRLAPVQCTSWGWPTTSGIKNVDYFISSNHLETEGSDNHYSEQLVRLESLPTYYYKPPVPENPKPLKDYGLDSSKNYYLCQQNLRKVHPDFDQLVDGIVDKDSNGVVLFINDKLESITQGLKDRLNKTVKNADRVSFLERMPEEDYLGLLKQVNVAIDTLHYGGGANTCYDAFACGTPLITLKGEFHRSRFGYAAYKQMGYDECIVESIEQYVDRAVGIGVNPKQRDEISISIKNASEILFEDQKAVEELLAFFDSALN